jgi:hypothetical protein
MDVNSNRLKLKLDMVYRDLASEEGEKRFADLDVPVDTKPLEAVQPKILAPPKKAKRKTVKALVPK